MSAGPFTVEAGERRVVARSAIAVPFEARGDARELRAALRSALERLVVGSDEVCSGTFHGPRRPGSDVENLLLYNLDTSGRLFDGGRGVRVEHAAPAAPLLNPPFTYVYEPLPVHAGFASWEMSGVLARWEDVEIPPGPPDRLLVRTCSALARSSGRERIGSAEGAVGVRVRLGLPERAHTVRHAPARRRSWARRPMAAARRPPGRG